VQLPYSVAELVAATHELLAANGLADCYVRPIAFYGYGTLGVPPRENPVYVAILSWPWGAYLGDAAAEHGIRVKVSSWRRVGPNTIPHAAKATGVYLNSMLAVGEANRAGYDEAILLTDEGTVGDGSGENVFAVRGAVLHARSVGVDPARHHPRHGRHDRTRPRVRGLRASADPHRPLRGRRAVPERHRRRGDADPVGRRRRARATRAGRPCHPGRLPRPP
jgi:hypothetical protein